MTIHEKLKVSDLLRAYPESKKALARLGMRCMSCKGRESESLKQAAENHGLSLERFLSEIKAAIKSGS